MTVFLLVKQQSINYVGPFFVDFVVLIICESASELCSGFSTCDH
jgi:hypothetical protein